MTPYQVMVEGVFVRAPPLGREVGGFHSTFFLKANNAQNASHRVRGLLADRMSRHGIAECGDSFWMTYCWIQELWEITEDQLSEEESKDLGFTFFRIGRVEKFYLAFRRWIFQRFKPWLLLEAKEDGGN